MVHCEDAFRTVLKNWLSLNLEMEPLTIHEQNSREMLRSCIGLGVAVAVLTKALKSPGGATKETLDVEIDKARYHPSFPVPSIKNKKQTPQKKR